MNFQNLSSVTRSQILLDSSFSSAKAACKNQIFKTNSEISKQRRKDVFKIEFIRDRLCGNLKNILKTYPIYTGLSDFYQELFKCYLDIDQYRQDLSKLKFAEKKIFSFSNKFAGMMKATDDLDHLRKLSSEFYGRVSSVLNRVDASLDRLEGFRRNLKSLPDIKDGIINVALFGFPNVGKSTILSKITSAKPEIAAYAFTTKKINVGYKRLNNISIQILDTPGTLNRFEVMNEIEKMAYLVMSKLADLVIYVFDPTYPYPIEDQKALFELAKKSKNCIALVSKVDLVDSEVIDMFKKEFGCITLDELDSVFEGVVRTWEREMLNKKLTSNNL